VILIELIGNYIKKLINGREISRFIFGGYSLESEYKYQKP